MQGLTPIGLYAADPANPQEKRCLVEDLESKGFRQNLGPGRPRHHMSGQPRELTFGDYSKLKIGILGSYGQDADTYQEVFQEIRRPAFRCWLDGREEGATVRFKERRLAAGARRFADSC